MRKFVGCRDDFSKITPIVIYGRLIDVTRLVGTVAGITRDLSVDDQVCLRGRDGTEVSGEVIAIRDGLARVLAFGDMGHLAPGTRVCRTTHGGNLSVDRSWLGRVIDPLGNPLDQRGPLRAGPIGRPVYAPPPVATHRARLGDWIDLGVRALDLFTPCRRGQRLGLFAGSGIGKSTLLAMLTRHTACTVVVLALVGERGREVREFLDDQLGPNGLARAVVVVATSDAAPPMRRRAAYAAMTIAEHFRDEGESVLLLVDSITRFCHALREIGLAAGEMPATRGYPPGVFAELPRLLERAGPGLGHSAGQITAMFTVLVEGDDQNEPVADAARGILDGHVVLDRRIAEAGRFPAVDVLRSLSRAAMGPESTARRQLVGRARSLLALHADMADMVRLGAYRPGADPAVDKALELVPRIEALLCQGSDAPSTTAEALVALAEILEQSGIPGGPHGA